MKIAMLSVHSCPLGRLGEENTGGMSVYIQELSRELGERGHQVDIFTRAHEPMHDSLVRFNRNVRLIHLKAGEAEKIPKLAVYDNLPEFVRRLEVFSRCEGLEYDLVHSHYWLSGWVGKRIQALWNIPHLIMFHTLGAVKNAVSIGEEEPSLRIETEKQLVVESDRIISSTEREREDLIRYYEASPQKIRIIPCGVNLDVFRPVDKRLARQRLGLDGEKIVLFVGRIVPIKGLEKLVMAMSLLEGKGLVRLVVIGEDDQRRTAVKRLADLTKMLRIGHAVTFYGFVEHKRLPLFYSAADVCVVPSYHESFSLVALEALACGTPVVGTPVGVLGCLIQPGLTGYVVTDNGPFHLAGKIALALTSLNGKRASIESFRDSVSAYSWSNITEAILHEYRDAIADFHRQKRRQRTQARDLSNHTLHIRGLKPAAR